MCACERACAHMCLHVHMCGHVQLQAVYSTDIISMSIQRWVVLISFPSMPFKQHGNHSGEWIWNKARMHWSGDSNFCLWIQAHTHRTVLWFKLHCLTDGLFPWVWHHFMYASNVGLQITILIICQLLLWLIRLLYNNHKRSLTFCCKNSEHLSSNNACALDFQTVILNKKQM